MFVHSAFLFVCLLVHNRYPLAMAQPVVGGRMCASGPAGPKRIGIESGPRMWCHLSDPTANRACSCFGPH